MEGLKRHGAAETAVGRRFHSFTNCPGDEGVEEDRVLCLFLVQALCSSGPRVRVLEEACWVNVHKATVDFVEHPQASLSSLLFKN